MLERRNGLVLVLVGCFLACCGITTQKSTGTNWLTCVKDADCARFPGSHCGPDRVCVDESGHPLQVGAGGGSGSGQDASFTDAGTGGAPVGGGPDASFTSAGGGGVSVGGGAGSGGIGGTSGIGDGAGGVGGQETMLTGCYSPGQNFTTAAFMPGSVGCRCSASQAPNGLCLKSSNGGVGALRCVKGLWQGAEDNGPCMGCWTPDQPEFANAYPDSGCACAVENESQCILTQFNGYATAVCVGGKWTVEQTRDACTCTSDLRCGLGGKCNGGSCGASVCEVDGVRYAVGVGDIPSPDDTCNTCQCETDGTLTCTKMACAQTSCDSGTVLSSTCVECGPTGGCALTRYGCLPKCQSSSDCAGTGMPVCDTKKQVCSSGACD